MRFTERTLHASKWAILQHANVNHLYDGSPYFLHLSEVASTASDFLFLIPIEDRETVICACWAHDVIEDCRVTFNDVILALGPDVAEIVYALTTEKGKSRAERANEKYYEGIKNTPYATFVKTCDRIANIRHSAITKSRMLKVYIKEHSSFKEKLFDRKYIELFDELEHLIARVKQIQVA